LSSALKSKQLKILPGGWRLICNLQTIVVDTALCWLPIWPANLAKLQHYAASWPRLIKDRPMQSQLGEDKDLGSHFLWVW